MATAKTGGRTLLSTLEEAYQEEGEGRRRREVGEEEEEEFLDTFPANLTLTKAGPPMCRMFQNQTEAIRCRTLLSLFLVIFVIITLHC